MHPALAQYVHYLILVNIWDYENMLLMRWVVHM